MKVARLENIGILANDSSIMGNYLLIKKVPKDYRIVDNRIKNTKRINAPLYLEVYPSFLCNFKCTFCYLKLLGINPDDSYQMSDKTIKSTIKICVDYGINSIGILGGEPFHPVNIKTTYKLIEESNKKDIAVDVTTNAYFLNNKIINFLNDNNTKLTISLHAIQSEESLKIIGFNCTERLKNIISNTVDGKIDYGLTTSILMTNIDTIDQMLNFVNNLSTCVAWVWKYVSVFNNFDNSTLLNITDFFELYKKYKNKIKTNTYFDAPFTYKYLEIKPQKTELDSILSLCCNPGESKAEVMPDGTIYSCVLFHEDKSQIVGNVNTKFDFTKEYGYKHLLCKNNMCVHIKKCTGCIAYAHLNNKLVDDRCEFRYK